MAGIHKKWEDSLSSAMQIASLIDPYQSELPEGVVIPAVEAAKWPRGHRSCDIRPRLIDKATGVARLIDSGSMITAVAKGPGDKVDSTKKVDSSQWFRN